MPITCGVDWAETHHDVALVDAEGQVVARSRVGVEATATKAMNGRPGISDKTRDRVRLVANSLAYGRPRVDRPSLGQVTIGVVVMTLDSHWVTPILTGLELALAGDSATILVTPPATGVTNARMRYESLLRQRVDGSS